MKQTLLLAFLLLTFYSTQAQIPGYQGKRFFVELGLSFFPNLGVPTLDFSNHFAIKAHYSLNFHHVLSRKTVFRLGYGFQASGLSYTSDYSYYYSTTTYQYHLLMHDLHFALDLYGKRIGNLAPLGFYVSPGFLFVFTQGIAKNSYGNQQPPSVVAFGLTGRIGYRAIFKQFVLNLAFEMTLFPQHVRVSTYSNEYGYYESEAIRTIANRYLFGFHIGIGVLM